VWCICRSKSAGLTAEDEVEAFYELVGAAPRLASTIDKRQDFIHKTIKIDFKPLSSKPAATVVRTPSVVPRVRVVLAAFRIALRSLSLIDFQAA